MKKITEIAAKLSFLEAAQFEHKIMYIKNKQEVEGQIKTLSASLSCMDKDSIAHGASIVLLELENTSLKKTVDEIKAKLNEAITALNDMQKKQADLEDSYNTD